MSTFYLEILAAEGAYFRGECESITIPAPDGRCGILPHHSPLISAIVPGQADFTTPDGARRAVLVGAGLMKVEDNAVLLLVDTAEAPEEAQANRARREAERAKEEELGRKSLREYQTAQAALARALERMRGDKDKRI